MKSITREWLQKTIAEFETSCDEIPFGMDADDAKILQVLKWKLTSLDAELLMPGHAIPPLLCHKSDLLQRAEKLAQETTELASRVKSGSVASDCKQVGELTMLVKRLCFSLKNAKPDSKLPGDAMDYLSRKGLISAADILR